jgi:hypothetical protein
VNTQLLRAPRRPRLHPADNRQRRMPSDSQNAHLELHQLNVGQGDCTVIVVRNLDKLRDAMEVAANAAKVPIDFNQNRPVDYLPWSLQFNKQAPGQKPPRQPVKLYGTVVKTLVVDGGNDCYGVALRNYLAEIGAIDLSKVREETLEVLVTHYHDDHQDGLRSMMRDPPQVKGQPTIDKVRPATFYRMAGKQGGAGTGRIATIVKELEEADTKAGAKATVVEIPRGGRADGKNPFTIPLGTITFVANDNGSLAAITAGKYTGNKKTLEIPIVCRILASDMAVLTPNGREEVPKRTVKGKQKVDQNDRSTVLVVEYGSFRHFIGGDAGGELGRAYADVEVKLAPAMKQVLAQPASKGAKFTNAGHCCSMKLNHHGTRFSNDQHFLGTLRPRLALIPAGVMAVPHGHPMPETVTRLVMDTWSMRDDTKDKGKSKMKQDVVNTLEQFAKNATKLNKYPNDHFAIFATEIAANIKKKKGGKLVAFTPDPDNKVPILGNIVVRPCDDDIGLLAIAQATGQLGLRIQVYGDLEFTPIGERGDYRLKAGVDPTGDMYPSGALTITCNQH